MPQSSSQRVRVVQVNKNLANYPLARDARTRQHWRRSKPTGRLWLCKLPGDKRIQFRLPGDIEEQSRHCPSAFDINVLFLLLAMAQEQGRHTITLRSSAAILQELGLGADTYNRRRLYHSLRYWSTIAIRYTCWYVGKEGGNKVYVKKVLPAPIQSLADNGRQVKLRQEWLTLNKGYFAPLPLPLPHNAAAQNVVLAVATSLKSIRNTEEGSRVAIAPHPRRIGSFHQKVGLDQSSRTRELRHALDACSSWYAKQGLFLVYEWKPPLIRFALGESERGALGKGTRAKPKLPGGRVTRYRREALPDAALSARDKSVRVAKRARQATTATAGATRIPKPDANASKSDANASPKPGAAPIPKVRLTKEDGWADGWGPFPDKEYYERHEIPEKWSSLRLE
jgi:hypothetical protein